MPLWSKRLFHWRKRPNRVIDRKRFLAPPERLEDRRMMAPLTWSGDIPDGTTWGPGEVNEITGNVHIPSGATLTVQPGAVIKFDTGREFKIDVDGRLMAQ